MDGEELIKALLKSTEKITRNHFDFPELNPAYECRDILRDILKLANDEEKEFILADLCIVDVDKVVKIDAFYDQHIGSWTIIKYNAVGSQVGCAEYCAARASKDRIVEELKKEHGIED